MQNFVVFVCFTVMDSQGHPPHVGAAHGNDVSAGNPPSIGSEFRVQGTGLCLPNHILTTPTYFFLHLGASLKFIRVAIKTLFYFFPNEDLCWKITLHFIVTPWDLHHI